MITKTLPIAIAILTLLVAGAALHAEEGESELDAAKRTIREQELTIDLRTKHVANLEAWNASLGKLLEQQEEARLAGRKVAASQVALLERRIDELREDLETEQARSGMDETELGNQLARERKRHVQDVQQLVAELAKANEVAERNRIEATRSMQRCALAEEKTLRLRDHLVHGVRLLGEIGPAARIAVRWLQDTTALADVVLPEAARTAIGRIAGGR